MKRNAFRKKLEAMGVQVNGTTEEFSGSKGGLWLSAEEGDAFNDGAWEFDPKEEKYTMGIRNDVMELGRDHGWFFEFDDPGTVMAYEV